MKISQINALIKSPSSRSKPNIHMHIGELLEVCAKDAVRGSVDLTSFLHWIKPAVLHDQFLLIKNEGEVHTSAYITWAFVNDATLQRYMHAPRFILHPSEWNEGQHLIIVDFCSRGEPQRIFSKMLKQAKLLANAGVASITACSRNDMGNPIKLYRIYDKHNHAP